MDDDERLTVEALRRAGDPERAASYADRSERRNRMLEDHERRIIKAEITMESMQADLREIASTAQTTRIEQNGMLQAIGSKVDHISREQTLEAGRKEAAAHLAAHAARVGDKRHDWMRFLATLAIPLALWIAYEFVLDVVAVRQAPVERLLEQEARP